MIHCNVDLVAFVMVVCAHPENAFMCVCVQNIQPFMRARLHAHVLGEVDMNFFKCYFILVALCLSG